MKRYLVFKGGTIVHETGSFSSDILVENDKIKAIGQFETPEDAEVVDCTGKLLLPGAIDAHCHIQLDTGIFQTPDNWEIGTSEAARGGITTVVDFVGPQPGEDLRHALDFRLKQAEIGIIDYTFHMTALDDAPKTLESIDKCYKDWGISSLKLYTTYRPNYYLDDSQILAILRRAAAAGLTTLIHCENDAIVTAESACHKDEPLWRAYPEMRPGIAEVEAAERIIRLAEYAHARVVIAHNSCAQTAAAVAEAKKRGVEVFNETTPQYLYLNADDNHNSPEPWRFILQPPLRTMADNLGLQKAVLDGDVDMMITDHCAYTREQKISAPNGTPGGLPGLETLLPLTAAIPGIQWTDVVRVLCRNPAKIYGLWPRKGALMPGFDADIVVLEDQTYTIDELKLTTFAGYSPFDGHQARGRICRVFRRGEEIVCNGEIKTKPGTGEFMGKR